MACALTVLGDNLRQEHALSTLEAIEALLSAFEHIDCTGLYPEGSSTTPIVLVIVAASSRLKIWPFVAVVVTKTVT